MKMYMGKEGNKRKVDHGPNALKTLTEQCLNKGHTRGRPSQRAVPQQKPYNKREVDHGPNVLKTLTEQYLNKGHTIFTDSFFTSADLVTHMQDRGTSHVGTVLKHRRGNPPDIAGKSVKVAKGKTAVRQKDGVVAVRFIPSMH
ncbi:hypothetical protein ACOMHN_061668 [Nucella lapillus]